MTRALISILTVNKHSRYMQILAKDILMSQFITVGYSGINNTGETI